MSKTCRPSNPAGTAWPSQVSPAPKAPGVPAGVFHARTTMSPYTATSPWFPSQNVRDTVRRIARVDEMSRMLNPSQLPWIARSPRNAMSVLMSGLAPPKPPSTAGSMMWPQRMHVVGARIGRVPGLRDRGQYKHGKGARYGKQQARHPSHRKPPERFDV